MGSGVSTFDKRQGAHLVQILREEYEILTEKAVLDAELQEALTKKFEETVTSINTEQAFASDSFLPPGGNRKARNSVSNTTRPPVVDKRPGHVRNKTYEKDLSQIAKRGSVDIKANAATLVSPGLKKTSTRRRSFVPNEALLNIIKDTASAVESTEAAANPAVTLIESVVTPDETKGFSPL